MNDKLQAALKKGGTITELMKAAKMSRGGVIQAIRREKSRIKKIGTRREHERGPESVIYALRSRPAKKAKAPAPRPTPNIRTPAPTAPSPAVEAQATLDEVAKANFEAALDDAAELEAAGLTPEVAKTALEKLDQAIAAEPLAAVGTAEPEATTDDYDPFAEVAP